MTNPRSKLDQNANAIINKLVELALEGDMTAIRLCVERILPRSKPDMGIHFDLPEGRLDTGENCLHIVNRITQAVTNGEMTVSEAETLTSFLQKQRWAIGEAERQCESERRWKQ